MRTIAGLFFTASVKAGTGFYTFNEIVQMKTFFFVNSFILLCAATEVQAQKKMTDGTIVYDIVIESSNPTQKSPDFTGAVTTVYLNGDKCRTEMVSSLGIESTIYDASSGKAVILKEYSGQKLMITLTKENWAEKNNSYNGLVFETVNETKLIAGYHCNKAIAKMDNGKSYIVYYTTELQASTKEYNPLFRNLPGMPMEYEIVKGRSKFRYTVAKINLDAVAASTFDFPKSGYRVMTYEENKEMKKLDQ